MQHIVGQRFCSRKKKKSKKNLEITFRVSRCGAINWTSVPHGRSRTAAALSME